MATETEIRNRGQRARRAFPWGAVAVLVGAIMVSAAIGLDDAELTAYQFKLINLILKGGGGLALAAGGLRYLIERRQELAWGKTRFIVELFEDFDQDVSCQRARDLLDYSYFSGDSSYLEEILASGGELPPARWRDRCVIDHYLDFFDRLSTHVFITKTLTVADVSSFSGYIRDIYLNPAVRSFALEWGYEDVLVFSEAFDDISQARDTELDQLRQRLQKTEVS